MGSSPSKTNNSTQQAATTDTAKPKDDKVEITYDPKDEASANKTLEAAGLMFKKNCTSSCTAQDHEDWNKTYGYVKKDECGACDTTKYVDKTKYDELETKYNALLAKQPEDKPEDKPAESFESYNSNTNSLLAILVFFALCFTVFYVVYLKNEAFSIGLQSPFVLNKKK